MGRPKELVFTTYLDKRHCDIMGFLADYPELEATFDATLLVANALAFGSTLEHGSKSMARTHCSVMWQIAASYHRQSLVHILTRELDAGFALLRMATELARDAYVIGKDENRLGLWMDREERPEEYRKVFKFDLSSPVGEYAFKLYKLSSCFGVHGHMTSLIHARATGETAAKGDGVIINTDEQAVFCGLQIWLRAIRYIHELFCEAFQLDRAPVGAPYRMFMELIHSLDPIIEAVDKKVGRRPEVGLN